MVQHSTVKQFTVQYLIVKICRELFRVYTLILIMWSTQPCRHNIM